MAQGSIQCDGYIIDYFDTKSLSNGTVLYRIRATKPRLGGIIPAGTLGGYVASFNNLSGDAWVDETSLVGSGDVRIMDNTCVKNGSEILGCATVMNNAVIDRSSIRERAQIGHSAIIQNSIIGQHSNVSGSACVYDSCIRGESEVVGATIISSYLAGTAVAYEGVTVINYGANDDEVFTDGKTYRGAEKDIIG